jgi:hypothetical protein
MIIDRREDAAPTSVEGRHRLRDDRAPLAAQAVGDGEIKT